MSDTNAGLGMVPHKPHCRCDECKIERLERALKLQRNAALTLADASAAVSGARLEQARKLFAESRPESVESERAMNAILTADVERLERERDELDGTVRLLSTVQTTLFTERDALRAEAEALRKDAERYRWLRSGCGHIKLHITKGGKRWGVARNAVSDYEMNNSLDAAIDAAIAKE